MEGQEVTILFAEDNESHARLVLRCLEDHSVSNTIYHVRDGEAALDFVHQRGDYSDPDLAPRPDVVLLDLRLPRVDGLDVLREIKESPDLMTIPVVILTTSDAETDVAQAYQLHANSYLVKPIDFETFSRMLGGLGFYWLAWNKSPAS